MPRSFDHNQNRLSLTGYPTPMSQPAIQKTDLLMLHRKMQTIRVCEERLAKSHQRGLIHGACHTYVGQEAVAAGVCAHLRRDDVVFSTHRGHGHALADRKSTRLNSSHALLSRMPSSA